jgi:hypothetical protein
MPLTFAEAYKQVCPNGGAVAPGSKEYNDIINLMNESGYESFMGKLEPDPEPKESAPTQSIPTQSNHPLLRVKSQQVKISKRQWLSVGANRELFINCLNKKK